MYQVFLLLPHPLVLTSFSTRNCDFNSSFYYVSMSFFFFKPEMFRTAVRICQTDVDRYALVSKEIFYLKEDILHGILVLQFHYLPADTSVTIFNKTFKRLYKIFLSHYCQKCIIWRFADF